ncbi:MAG: hypothetical protein RL213_1704 [Bacteroidota bacterium]|jgi:DNA-binding transcriptional MerR regulator
MPYKEKEIEKLYYSIGEVADMFGVNTSHIRFWSNEFDVIRPATNKKGNRLYTRDDIDNFRKIYHLVKEKGYTLRGAKTELKEMKLRPGTDVAVEELTETETLSVASEPTLFDRPLSAEGTSPLPTANNDDFVDRMALRSSLEKVREQLLELRKEIETMAVA